MNTQEQRGRFEAWHNAFYGTVGVRSLQWDDRIGYLDCTVQAQMVAFQAAEAAAVERCARICEEWHGSANAQTAVAIRALLKSDEAKS